MPRVEQVQQKALDEFRQKNLNSKKRKKQEKSNQVNEMIITFVCLFFILSVVFLHVVKGLTPQIDTSVGNNTSEEVQEVRDSKMKVDDRLKLIQFNDSMVSGEIQKQKENSIFNTSLDELVVLPSRKNRAEEQTTEEKKTVEKTLDEKVSNIISQNLSPEKTEKTTSAAEQTEPAPAPVPMQPPSYKVYVGLYQTNEQAQTAKSIIKESSLGQNAFVKLTKEGYTLQIGSYSAKPQAEAVVQALKVNNFPLARMSEER